MPAVPSRSATGASAFHTASSAPRPSATGGTAAGAAAVSRPHAQLRVARLASLLQLRGLSTPLVVGPADNVRREHVLSARGVPAGKARALALEGSMRALRQHYSGSVLGFECGAPASWGRRKEVVVWWAETAEASLHADLVGVGSPPPGGCLGVAGVDYHSRPARRPPLDVTPIRLFQLPRELCRQGIGECLLEAAGISDATVVAEFHPAAGGAGAVAAELPWADTSRVELWVRAKPGVEEPSLHQLPALFHAGDRTVRVSVGWPESVLATEMPGRGAAAAASAGRSPPPPERFPNGHAAPGPQRRRRGRRRRRRAARRRAAQAEGAAGASPAPSTAGGASAAAAAGGAEGGAGTAAGASRAPPAPAPRARSPPADDAEMGQQKRQRPERPPALDGGDAAGAPTRKAQQAAGGSKGPGTTPPATSPPTRAARARRQAPLPPPQALSMPGVSKRRAALRGAPAAAASGRRRVQLVGATARGGSASGAGGRPSPTMRAGAARPAPASGASAPPAVLSSGRVSTPPGTWWRAADLKS